MAFIEGPRSAEVSGYQPESAEIVRDQPRSAGRVLGRSMTFIEGPAGGSRGEILTFIEGIAEVWLCQGTMARLTGCHAPATAEVRGPAHAQEQHPPRHRQ